MSEQLQKKIMLLNEIIKEKNKSRNSKQFKKGI